MSDQANPDEVKPVPRETLNEVTCGGGGPLDGKKYLVRKDKGVLAVDKEGNRAWVYDSDGLGGAVVRDPIGDELDYGKRMKAAGEWNYDIIAIDTSGEASA